MSKLTVLMLGTALSLLAQQPNPFAAPAPEFAATSTPTPPPDVDAALRERINKFFQAHVDGKFRMADEYVAEDSKDFFYAMEKPRYLKVHGTKIEYSDNFTKAKVNTMVEAEWRIARMGAMLVKPLIPTSWKLENGQWYWYRNDPKRVETPFGVANIPDDLETQRSARVASQRHMTVGEVLNQVVINKTQFYLSSYQDSEDEIVITNKLPGQVTVELRGTAIPYLTVSPLKKSLQGGESVKVKFTYKPLTKSPKSTSIVTVHVDPTNQDIPVTLLFAVPQELRREGTNSIH
jgi:hypothetical protein